MRKIALFMLVLTFTLNISAMAQPKKTDKKIKFVIHTDYGDMKGFLYNETPKHRDNFVKIAKDGTLSGTLFHRVIKDFMIQGGDPDSKTAKPGQALGMGDLGYKVPAEFVPSLIHKKGALAAARTDAGNPEKASSASQFYIVQGKKIDPSQLPDKYTAQQKEIYKTVGGTPFLDGSYTVYGEITEGLDVIDKIAAVQCDQANRPIKDIKMTVKIVE
jgi:cyclophilin family peptidyl-prolyl cis-trans isomerase